MTSKIITQKNKEMSEHDKALDEDAELIEIERQSDELVSSIP